MTPSTPKEAKELVRRAVVDAFDVAALAGDTAHEVIAEDGDGLVVEIRSAALARPVRLRVTVDAIEKE